ncbi:hypothetical protein WKR88_08405 [Trinickia caryophylli]|uniref:Uncharacterized protein n=1 Tax=Trinickia caryophylli TaxID=28094 RepID=A0A1X7EFH8_TRICW|nr:hypothetical protein [Trinickia caryophylli]PMS11133.1 hypothetical protein C0Z17_16765 [Trinickia caryophylli]TRX14591.1 hypothetical protein FNF07_25390 [Trinickia caryophylli]WQE14431.1 hypothetical protein U0034_27580 [Trinickia caryophylli]SMF32582.1 hypothetical protein SAMN06295900_105283 [Trinickia caryophylli]GLU32167.1 hypothetical protein Busp01_20090 [Trinickia caryophylli]
MKLRMGALCLFDNPTDEDGRALIRQFVLATVELLSRGRLAMAADAVASGSADRAAASPVDGVVIVPTSANFDDAKHILADIVDEVLPLLDD